MSINASRYNSPYVTAFDTTGVVSPEALLFFYLSGTSTPADTYTDAGLTIPNSNPVQANAAGLFPNIFLVPSQLYKVVLETSDGDEIWTADPVFSAGVNPISFYTTLASLRAFGAAQNGTAVYLEGAVTAGDGIQGMFVYNSASTAPDDGGQTTIAPTGVVTGRWIRDPLGWTNGGMTNNGGALYHGGIGDTTVNGINVARVDAQIELQNGSSGHTLLSLFNNNPTTEENAISAYSLDNLGNFTQQLGWFTRWYQGNNDRTTGINLTGWHNVGGTLGGQDSTVYVGYSDNSALYQAGATSGSPWNSAKPPAGWGRNLGSGVLHDNALVLGNGHGFSVKSGYLLEVNGNAQVGDVDGGGATDHAVQFGYSSGGSTAFIQSFRNSTAAFIPLAITGSTITLGATAAAVTIANATGTGIRFNGYGAGTITADGSGNLTSVSDLRMKTAVEKYRPGLLKVISVSPISYRWNEDSGMETEGRYAGFGAQHLAVAGLDLAARENKDGIYSVDDRALIATLWNATRTLTVVLVATWAVLGVIVWRLF